ncbi:alpha-N-arabinofuranosidase [Parapedobacter pyrenivorans]|uniref:non-reducing end alpha-L-arabinofuranosidase n=1 Tax=Parapedobacter pyrenivorans TaxID=1305674 RepID=A0A917HXY8_9SPHI|nr:alpha-L-arabinofuranosidase C-terminal domain-containing protein [Parapedobacter pyrenivorans]GGG97248.1 alpha-N-arabinofuranosidase [Parapedobacter pyrenivorans]
MQQKSNPIIRYFAVLACLWGCQPAQAQRTTVKVEIPDVPVQVDPMIYGQMLENVNDSMIYGGIADLQGNVRQHLVPQLVDLDIPVMRWPGGTVVYEYHWEKGIGPKEKRPTVPNLAWGGIENYQFGTDEFLQWCQAVGTVPYVNLNMSLHPEFRATVADALAWIEYVNGSADTPYGRLRIQNGHAEPYNVKFWGIGNENYLDSRAGRIKETAEQYATRLKYWAGAIRAQHPDLQLLSIGRSIPWNQTVLDTCGRLIDFLTQHYYVNSKVKDGEIQQPASTLFAPAKMEAHLALLGNQLAVVNEQLGRADRPIRLSVDEWNNRHSVNEGTTFKFTRQSPRRQFDVAVVAGMLNAFIRQSPHVGMANYIFPVNAHGLIRTVGDTDAYQTPIYHVFKHYRQHLVGMKVEATVNGPSIATMDIQPTIDGDSREAEFTVDSLTYIDAAAVLTGNRHLQVSLVNRSHATAHSVTVDAPEGYTAQSIWMLSHENINAANSSDHRSEVAPRIEPVVGHHSHVRTEIPPGGLHIIQFIPKK